MGNILKTINSSKKKYANREAIVYREGNDYKNISYKELYEYITSLAFHLDKFKGKTIAIIGNNKLEYVVSLLSVLSYIGDAFLIDKELSEEDINVIFKNRKPDLIILDDELSLSFSKYKTLRFSDVTKKMKDKKDYKASSGFAGNLILHTSGTTGVPKCVVLDEKNYFGVIPELNKKWQVVCEQSCLLIIPLYHIYALVCLFHGLYAGIANILEWDFKNLNKVLVETKPALFMGVPLMYNKIKDVAMEKAGSKIKFGIALSNFLLKFKIDIRKKLFVDLHNYFGGNYVFGCSAGSLLPYETNKFFNDVGLPVYNVYGMTETSGPIAINYADHNIYESVGEILDVNKVKIINEDENGIGEVYVKGSNVFKGYIGDKDKNYILDGYFDTGDLGYVKDNFLYICGRKKNILIGANGKNISPLELRDKILKSKQIHDCKIVMEDNKLVAYVNTTLNKEEVEKFIAKVNKGLPKYKQISKVEITEKNLK